MTLAITLFFLAIVGSMAWHNAKNRTPETVSADMDAEWSEAATTLGLEHRRTGTDEVGHEIVGSIDGHDLKITPHEFVISFSPTDAPADMVLEHRHLTGRLLDEPRPDAPRPARSFEQLVKVVNRSPAAETFLTPARRAALEPLYNHRHLANIAVARTFIEATPYLSRLPTGHHFYASPVAEAPLPVSQIGSVVSLLVAAANALASPQRS